MAASTSFLLHRGRDNVNMRDRAGQAVLGSPSVRSRAIPIVRECSRYASVGNNCPPCPLPMFEYGPGTRGGRERHGVVPDRSKEHEKEISEQWRGGGSTCSPVVHSGGGDQSASVKRERPARSCRASVVVGRRVPAEASGQRVNSMVLISGHIVHALSIGLNYGTVKPFYYFSCLLLGLLLISHVYYWG